MSSRLRLAIQKKGRLAEESIQLLRQCGLQFRLREQGLLAHIDNFAIDLLLVRDDDIPNLVFDNLCDGGIVGENVLQEAVLARNSIRYETVLQLNACYCRLAIAVPAEFNWQNPKSLENKKIATSYPHLLRDYLSRNNVNAECVLLSGSVEMAPRMGMADAICDLVSTGQTLEENKLIEVDTVFKSEATLIQTTQTLSEEKQKLFAMLSRRIQAVRQAQMRKYILFHAPIAHLTEIVACLPGAESPTVIAMPEDPKKVIVHVVSNEENFWDTLENIQRLGASSILVLPIEKMLM